MKRKRIIHLDDHRLVCEGVTRLVNSLYPRHTSLHFQDANLAFRYLINSVETGNSPDLFITDFMHPGMDGYKLSKAVRQLEILLARKPMPILLLTMYPKELPAISKGLQEKVFSNYLSLDTTEEQILEFVKRGLFHS